MISCILCLNKVLKKNSIAISSKEECEATVEELIKLHFPFTEKISLQSSSVVCKTCWNKLESFHEFFCAVKSNHKVEDEPATLNEVFVKNELPDEEDVAMTLSQDDFTFSPYQNDTSEEAEEGPSPKKSKKSVKSEKKQIRFNITEEELEVLRLHADFKCEKCPYMLSDWKDVRTHYRQTHKILGYLRCCKRKFDRANELKDHVSWHLNPHIFQCHICGKSAISRENLKLHEEVHVPVEDRQFTCPKCDKKFVNKYNLNNHIKTHEKEGRAASIPCKFCDKLYKTEQQLKLHIHHCHKDSQEWICHICSKVLKSRYTLDIHVKAHTNPDNPIECDICGHILKNKRRFAIHMSKHKSAEAGPYECEKGCGKIFRHRPAMLDHVAFVHTKNRFNCSFCGKEFKHKKPLDEHEATQHGGVDLYSCPFCERSFKSGANMHAHKKKAHPEEYKNLPAPSYLRGSIGDYCE